MKKPFTLSTLLAAMLCASLLFSCTSDIEPPPPQEPSSSSADEPSNLCVYAETRQCFSTPQNTCPAGGELSAFCPFPTQSSSSLAEVPSGSSSSLAGQSSGGSSSSGGTEPEYSYCVFDAMCLNGPVSVCPPGGTPSNVCPYSSSSSAVVSSPSVASSSSIVLPPPSSSSIFIVPSSSSSFGGTSGTFTDARDSKIYRWVKIGTQVWMAENLNFNAEGSKCYNYLESNCTTYGRLYDWSMAMALASTYNSTLYSATAKHKGSCPAGWHIPSDAEWGALVQFINPSCSLTGNCANVGKLLKATSGWNSYNGQSGNGTDVYGFAALSGGAGGSSGGFVNVGIVGYWWSSNEYSNNDAYRRYMNNDREDALYINVGKGDLHSVRCLQDIEPLVPSSSSLSLPSSSSKPSATGDYCFYGAGNCHKMPTNDNCASGTLVNSCDNASGQYCDYGVCTGGDKWDCPYGGGCYVKKSGDTCSGGSTVTTCPSDHLSPCGKNPDGPGCN